MALCMSSTSISIYASRSHLPIWLASLFRVDIRPQLVEEIRISIEEKCYLPRNYPLPANPLVGCKVCLWLISHRRWVI